MTGQIEIAVGGARIELSHDAASALADHLWKGLEPGAVTAAARLSEALTQRERGGSPAVEFEPYELEAVRDGLNAVGLASPYPS